LRRIGREVEVNFLFQISAAGQGGQQDREAQQERKVSDCHTIRILSVGRAGSEFEIPGQGTENREEGNLFGGDTGRDGERVFRRVGPLRILRFQEEEEGISPVGEVEDAQGQVAFPPFREQLIHDAQVRPEEIRKAESIPFSV
jgi:hypothetical protein